MNIVADAGPTVDPMLVSVGVDTHSDTHTAAVIDPLGRHLGDRTFRATPAGYQALVVWARGFGTLDRVGVEGTGSYGAGLARALTKAGAQVIEVDRPDRKARRQQGKSDPVDAYAAATAAASGRASAVPKTRDGDVESVRALRVARTGAVRTRARAKTQLKSLVVTAPDTLRSKLRGLKDDQLVTVCARLRPARDQPGATGQLGRLVGPTAATKRALAAIATRVQHLDAEIDELDKDLTALVTPLAPNLLALHGVGPEVAGQLLVTAGDNPDRLRNEAAFAHLCGVAPLPASSGKTTRHRLNRGGDRAANAALYRIVICRLQWHSATRVYVERRTKQGRSKAEIIRCLKRYVAREVLTAIRADLCPTTS